MAKIIVAEIKYPLNPEYYSSQVQLFYFIALGLAVLGGFTNASSQAFFAFVSKDSVKVLKMDAYRKIVNMPA